MPYQCKDSRKIVFFLDFVRAFEPAMIATMRYPIGIACFFNSDWSHGTATIRRPIARLNIDMSAPKAMRAMIGIAITLNDFAAIQALKIFYSALKFLGDGIPLPAFSYYDLCQGRFKADIISRYKFPVGS